MLHVASVLVFLSTASCRGSRCMKLASGDCGGLVRYRAPSGRGCHRWSPRLTKQHAMSAAQLQRALWDHRGLWQTQASSNLDCN